MPNRHILLMVVYATLILPVSSQSLNFKNFTSRDGLPSSSVYETLQDRNGFMWFATSGGISRFDEYTYTNYAMEETKQKNKFNLTNEDKAIPVRQTEPCNHHSTLSLR